MILELDKSLSRRERQKFQGSAEEISERANLPVFRRLKSQTSGSPSLIFPRYA
jgi:hypothetical protein